MDEIRPGVVANWENAGIKSQREYEKIRKPEDPPTFDEYWQRIDPLLPVKARVNLIVKAILDNDIVGQHVNKMRWKVTDVSRSPHRFLTSDRPLMMWRLKEPNGYIGIPISPTKLFFATNSEEAAKNILSASPKEIVKQTNIHTVSRARRFVFAHDRTQERFVEIACRPTWRRSPSFPLLESQPLKKRSHSLMTMKRKRTKRQVLRGRQERERKVPSGKIITANGSNCPDDKRDAWL